MVDPSSSEQSTVALFNDKSKKEFRRALRNEPTYAERALWNGIRRIGVGAKFRRQESIGNFVVDFYCPELMLAVEVDGASHTGREAYDRFRDESLSAIDIVTLRFTDTDVLHASDRVVNEIREVVEQMRKEGISVRKRTSQLSPHERLKLSLGQPPPNPRLEKAGGREVRLEKAGGREVRLEKAGGREVRLEKAGGAGARLEPERGDGYAA